MLEIKVTPFRHEPNVVEIDGKRFNATKIELDYEEPIHAERGAEAVLTLTIPVAAFEHTYTTESETMIFRVDTLDE